MRRREWSSRTVCSISVGSGLAAAPPEGLLGPIWISAGGGGLGRRGELGASAMVDDCAARRVRCLGVMRRRKLFGRGREAGDGLRGVGLLYYGTG